MKGINIFKLAALGVVFIVGLWILSGFFVSVDQNDIMVIQNPVSGHLTWYTTGGAHLQWFGKVTKYHKRTQFNFTSTRDDKDKQDKSIVVRFNDGGHANIFGSIAWEMPLDEQHLNIIHQKYGSQDAVEQQLVRTIVEKCVYMTGPLMSSAESYAERRNDLIQLMEDQVANGVLQTETVEQKQPDPITGEQKTVSVVKLKSLGGVLLRQEESPLKSFGIKTFNLSINNVKYDDRVEAQIQQQQQAKMQVQTAIANAKMAEQAAITAQKNGEAEAAKAKWEQEVIKARAVTEGQQKLAVAELETKAAAQYKQSEILRGEGEGAYKKAVMQADGALDKKLAALIEINKNWASALASGNVKVTPDIVMGGGSGSNTSAMTFMELLNAKAAKDLALDTSLPSGNHSKGNKQ